MTIAPARRPLPTPTAEHVSAPVHTDAPHHSLNTRLSTAVALDRPHPPKWSGKPNPMAHLSNAEIEQIGIELDQLRQEVLDSRGASEAAYIRRVIKTQRGLEMASRGVLLFSAFPPAFILGTVGLSVSKILENMEIGHNVMLGQWDWMRGPKIHSTTWEWDNASPSKQWTATTNCTTPYTNVLGRDNDLGYGAALDEDQR